ARQQYDPGGEERQRRRRPPAVALGLREPVDEGEQTGGRGERAGDVEPRAGRADLVFHEGQGAERRRDREGEVYVHGPAPGQRLGEDAPKQQAEGAGAAGDSAVDAERPQALAGDGERGREQRERRGREQRAEHALDGAGADEHAEALRRAARRGRDRESDQADDERALAPEEIAEPAAEQQQAA